MLTGIQIVSAMLFAMPAVVGRRVIGSARRRGSIKILRAPCKRANFNAGAADLEELRQRLSRNSYWKRAFLTARSGFSISRTQQWSFDMLGWALTFLVIAIIAGIFGFGGIAATSAGIAQVIFVVFLILFAISLIAGLIRRT